MSDGPELPEESEKGPLGILITGTAIAAFAASNLYVFGLSLALNQSLAIHFEVLDYLQITPAWAFPAFILYGSIDLAAIFTVFFYYWLSDEGKSLFEKKPLSGQHAEQRAFPIPFLEWLLAIVIWPLKACAWVFVKFCQAFTWPLRKLSAWMKGADICFASLLLLAYFQYCSHSVKFLQHYSHSGDFIKEEKDTFRRVVPVLATVTFARIVSLAVALGLRRLKQKNYRSLIDFGVLEARYPNVFATAAGVLSFAFFFGLLVAPRLIAEGVISKVSLVEEGPHVEGHVNVPGTEITFERDKNEVDGRIVFRLSHSLLLMTQSQRLLVIPEEKIEKTEIPSRAKTEEKR
jgi:hypothetical protein